jgi:hypothetical protein
MLNAVMLNVVRVFYAECHYAECHYAECHYAECCGAKKTASTYIQQILNWTPKVDKKLDRFYSISLLIAKIFSPISYEQTRLGASL